MIQTGISNLPEDSQMKLPYSEGSFFRLPLRDGCYARGVVARMPRKGIILMGYFFGPSLSTHEPIESFDLHPANAVLRVRFGDLGLIRGEWTVHGKLPGWDRSKWPIPDFAIRDPSGIRRPILVHYSEDDPSRVEAEYLVDDASGLQTESLYGAGAVEITLRKLLAPKD